MDRCDTFKLFIAEKSVKNTKCYCFLQTFDSIKIQSNNLFNFVLKREKHTKRFTNKIKTNDHTSHINT